jgi:hypothetical protein
LTADFCSRLPDLNDYVECSRLTTLALEVARGQRPHPYVVDEEGELLRRNGERMSARTSLTCAP